MSEVADELRETSSATTRLVLGHVRDRTGDRGVARVLQAADVPHTLAELEDPSNWVSYEARCRLFEATAAELDSPDALFQVGASVIDKSVSSSLILLLRGLGSPRQAFRQLPRAVSKFSTTSTMTVPKSSATSATLRYVLHDGYRPCRLDCDYARGLISTVPQIFGLPPAEIVHDVCQADGHPCCEYRITWYRRQRWGPRRSADASEVTALRHQLHDLQAASADLVASDDLAKVLQRITERAASSVLAHGYVLAVHPSDGGAPLLHATGVPASQVAGLGERLLAGDDLGPRAVVVDVASSRRYHGRLAALYTDGQLAMHDERRLLAAYASHAAAALDLVSALEDSRRDGDRSRALLALSHSMAGVHDIDEVARLVGDALPVVVGCAHAGVLLWDDASGELRTAATNGLPADEAAVMAAAVLRPIEVPELADLVTTRQPVTLDVTTATPALRTLLGQLGVEHCLVVPLLGGDDLLGVTTASWGRRPPPSVAYELLLRLRGVADQAATALHGARLLSTVRHQALHDALTGLPNRVLFADRLAAALATDPGTSVLFCDLDRFKQVNDQLGHAAGDELLRQVAARLQVALPEGALVGRLSSDEFAVLLVGDADPRQTAELLVGSFERPFRLEGRELRVTVSVGVARAQPGDLRSDALLRASDGAMYEAKQHGRNQISVAAADEAADGPGAASFEQELRTAIREGQLHLGYQPVVALSDAGAPSATRQVVAVEALVRWQHPRLGALSPAAFLPVAQESDLMVELDLWVLGEATRALGAWVAENPTPRSGWRSTCPVAAWPTRACGAPSLRRWRAAASPPRLELEVVESRTLVDVPGVAERLAALQRLGITIALDDFGTGFSTLTWLQQLPADRVKLDRTFTAALSADPAGSALVRGVLALARELGLGLVGEGVETAEQLTALQAAGCDLFQGYLLGRPSPVDQALAPGSLCSVT